MQDSFRRWLLLSLFSVKILTKTNRQKGSELWDQTEALSDSAPVSSTTEGMLVLVVLVRSKCNTATRVYYIMHTTYNTIVQVHAFTYQAGK